MVEGALSLFWIKKKINKKCKKRKKGKKKKSNTVTYNLNKHAIINIFTLTPSPPLCSRDHNMQTSSLMIY